MQRILRNIAVALAVTSCVASPGCSNGHGFGVATHGASGVNQDGSTYNYTIDRLTCDGRAYLVLAVDGCSGGTANGGQPAHGQYLSPEGRKVDWSCSTGDGRSGSVSIAGRPFDLARGGVFLISAKGDPAKVEQLAVDMGKFRGGDVVEELRALAPAEPQIAAFFARVDGGK